MSAAGSGPRAALFGQVAALLPDVRRPLLVAVDGPDGVGKTTFADELVDVLADVLGGARPIVRASVDDFHHPRVHRHALGRTPESVWSRHFDYPALRRCLLDPWLAGAGADYRRRWHDEARDELLDAPAEPVPAGGVLVVDGVFLQRPELEQAWDLVVFLDAPPEVTVARLAARDGSPADPDHPDQRRYLGAQRLYDRACSPRTGADVLVDYRDLEAPQVTSPAAAPAPPPGWTVHGDQLLRTVRLPATAVAEAAAIDRIIDGGDVEIVQ